MDFTHLINKDKLVRHVTMFVNLERDPDSYITLKETNKIISAIFEIITETVANGDRVVLVNFGAFETRTRKECKRNFGRGFGKGKSVSVIIAAKTVPIFSAGKKFKNAVKNGKRNKARWLNR